MTITIRALNQREILSFYFVHHFGACIGGRELLLAQIKVNSNNRKNVSFFCQYFVKKLRRNNYFSLLMC